MHIHTQIQLYFIKEEFIKMFIGLIGIQICFILYTSVMQSWARIDKGQKNMLYFSHASLVFYFL